MSHEYLFDKVLIVRVSRGIIREGRRYIHQIQAPFSSQVGTCGWQTIHADGTSRRLTLFNKAVPKLLRTLATLQLFVHLSGMACQQR